MPVPNVFLQSEHDPPHIHVIYHEDVAAIDFMTGEVLERYLPAKALALVREWLSLHKNGLQETGETQEFKYYRFLGSRRTIPPSSPALPRTWAATKSFGMTN